MRDEASYLGIPSVVFRGANHRDVTLSTQHQAFVGADSSEIVRTVRAMLAADNLAASEYPEEWDFHVGQRIAQVLVGEQVF